MACGQTTIKHRVHDGLQPLVNFIVPGTHKLDRAIAQLDQRVDPLLPAVCFVAEIPPLALGVTGDDEATRAAVAADLLFAALPRSRPAAIVAAWPLPPPESNLSLGRVIPLQEQTVFYLLVQPRPLFPHLLHPQK